MAELKAKENKASVSEFLASIDDKQKSENVGKYNSRF